MADKSLFWTVLILAYVVCVVKCNVEHMYQWSRIEYEWRDEEQMRMAETKGDYIRNNTAITGIKVYKDKVYLTTPRFKEGVPATLGWLPRNPRGLATNVMLKPFPSWEMQEIGNCTAIQFGQSMEIDPRGRMWIIDVGSVNIFSHRINKCPPKLLIYDLNNNKEIFRYVFPTNVVSHTQNFLNDIVLDVSDPNDIYAYITDALDPGIVVYSHKQQQSWRAKHQSMEADNNAVNIEFPDQNFTVVLHIDGIALSPLKYRSREVYYSAISGYMLFSLPVYVLRNEALATGNLDRYVREVGRKQSQSDGYAMDSAGYLYYSLLGKGAVYRWNSWFDFETHQEELAQDDVTLQWVDTFAIDEFGFLWFTSNKIHDHIVGKLDPSDISFHVMRTFIGSKSYMHPESELMDRAANDSENSATDIRSALLILCTCLMVLVKYV